MKVAEALAYRKRLLAIEPNVTFLMSLYLHPSMTLQTVIDAKAAGIVGIKSYPAGVTTNSAAGVVDYTAFFPIFAEMERQGLILNLHGECPSTSHPTRSSMMDTSVQGTNQEPPREATTVLNAEAHFLPQLFALHQRFPSLRIVLEHLTTAAAVHAVLQCGPTVAGTITAHHLHLTIDDWAGNPHAYCKPVAKTPADRAMLLRAATSGNSKFFFGSDSAPHPVQAKGRDGTGTVAAGVFTAANATGLVLDAVEKAVKDGILIDEEVRKEALQGFLGGFGKKFYGVDQERERYIVLGDGEHRGQTIQKSLRTDTGDLEVVPFRAGERTWGLQWEKHSRMGLYS